jgi:hypothetical protein
MKDISFVSLAQEIKKINDVDTITISIKDNVKKINIIHTLRLALTEKPEYL